MAQIKKINIKGVEYDIAGSGRGTTDTAYVDNKTLYIEDGTITGGGDIKYITLSAPATETQGRMTSDQLAVLLENRSNYIHFMNENFYPQDVEIEQGYIVYSHVGSKNNQVIIKNINVTIATGEWVLSQLGLGESNTNVIYIDQLLQDDYGYILPSEFANKSVDF
jgi:hypothetical protein